MSQDKGTTYNISPIIKEYPTKEDFFWSYSVVTFLATGTVLATNRSPARKYRMICMKFFLSVRSILCAPLYRVSKAEVEILSQERANTSSKCRIVVNQVYDL